jgi:hypothetical protein
MTDRTSEIRLTEEWDELSHENKLLVNHLIIRTSEFEKALLLKETYSFRRLPPKFISALMDDYCNMKPDDPRCQ